MTTILTMKRPFIRRPDDRVVSDALFLEPDFKILFFSNLSITLVNWRLIKR